jgi:tetratricopeptide (TPR) repeat protein
MNYGLSQMQHGRYARAKELFTKAQTLAPNYAVLEVNLGVVNDAMGDGLAAERHFARALQLEPNYAGGHLYYGRWLVEHQQGPEAIPHLQRAVGLSAADADARELLMNLYAARGATTALKSLASETLRLAGNGTVARAYAADTFPFSVARPSYQSLFDLGLRFTRDRRHVEAAQAYRAALGFDSGSTDAWNNLGWSLAQLGFYDEAIAAYEQALRLRPDLARARNNLTMAENARSESRFKRAFRLQQAGELDEAIRTYRDLLAHNPSWVNAHYNLGHALMTQGRCPDAVVEFKQTLALQPAHAGAQLNLASCLVKLGSQDHDVP